MVKNLPSFFFFLKKRRLRLSMQGAWVRSLVERLPPAAGQLKSHTARDLLCNYTKSVCHNGDSEQPEKNFKIIKKKNF